MYIHERLKKFLNEMIGFGFSVSSIAGVMLGKTNGPTQLNSFMNKGRKLGIGPLSKLTETLPGYTLWVGPVPEDSELMEKLKQECDNFFNELKKELLKNEKTIKARKPRKGREFDQSIIKQILENS